MKRRLEEFPAEISRIGDRKGHFTVAFASFRRSCASSAYRATPCRDLACGWKLGNKLTSTVSTNTA